MERLERRIQLAEQRFSPQPKGTTIDPAALIQRVLLEKARLIALSEDAYQMELDKPSGSSEVRAARLGAAFGRLDGRAQREKERLLKLPYEDLMKAIEEPLDPKEDSYLIQQARRDAVQQKLYPRPQPAPKDPLELDWIQAMMAERSKIQ